MTFWLVLASVLGLAIYLLGVATHLEWIGWIGIVAVLSIGVPRIYYIWKAGKAQQRKWEQERAEQLGLAPDDPTVYEHAIVDPIDWKTLRQRRRNRFVAKSSTEQQTDAKNP